MKLLSGVGVRIAVTSADREGTREGRCAGSVLFVELDCSYRYVHWRKSTKLYLRISAFFCTDVILIKMLVRQAFITQTLDIAHQSYSFSCTWSLCKIGYKHH